MFAYVLQGTLAPVPTHFIDANTSVLAGRGVSITLIHVLFAGFSREERCAGTDVVGLNSRALATVGTWI